MARPIPANPAGLHSPYHTVVQQPYHTVAQPYVTARPARWRPAVLRAASPSRLKQGFLLVSTLTGGLAMVISLELIPTVTASALGLGERGAFFLLMAGLYLLVSACYAAFRTRLLRNLNQAPCDARLLAYGNLAVGGAVSIALVMALLMGMAILALVVAPTALLLRGWSDTSS